MEITFFTLVFCVCFVQKSLGLPSLTCDDVDPILSSTVKCSCQNVGTPGIDWYRGGIFITPCTLGGLCFSSTGYTFTVDVTTSTYTIEFGSYNYTECTNVTCSDSTTPSDSDFKHISVDVTSYSPTLSVVNEPASSHMIGNIDFTTDCIYKANSSHINTTAIWKAVVNGTEEDELDIDGTISQTGSCQFCTTDFASKIMVSYIHQEEQSESGIKAKIRLRLLIDGVPYTVTTRNEYFVKGKKESSNTTTTITNSTSTSDVIKNTTSNSFIIITMHQYQYYRTARMLLYFIQVWHATLLFLQL
ncbi:uncharacterized protein LOC132744505 [Ruditapes philippinarum]|uniref:uncharacterized protein LOC132744505 n=1 Tax=Ruditapes philippinarum TaxID=129788 RepID=UPI00295C0F09|nr:uncharacterized protein LOC132744505 [Ruditapes philippinarum]